MPFLERIASNSWRRERKKKTFQNKCFVTLFHWGWNEYRIRHSISMEKLFFRNKYCTSLRWDSVFRLFSSCIVWAVGAKRVFCDRHKFVAVSINNCRFHLLWQIELIRLLVPHCTIFIFIIAFNYRKYKKMEKHKINKKWKKNRRIKNVDKIHTFYSIKSTYFTDHLLNCEHFVYCLSRNSIALHIAHIRAIFHYRPQSSSISSIIISNELSIAHIWHSRQYLLMDRCYTVLLYRC